MTDHYIIGSKMQFFPIVLIKISRDFSSLHYQKYACCNSIRSAVTAQNLEPTFAEKTALVISSSGPFGWPVLLEKNRPI